MMGWRHSGFNVFCGPTIWSRDEKGMENLARYITRGASACAARPSLFFAGSETRTENSMVLMPVYY